MDRNLKITFTRNRLTGDFRMLAIDAAGLHPTTECCLDALQWLSERKDVSRVLEMGCGHGILSLTAAGIWDAQVLAADIEPKAVADTLAQCAEFDMEEHVRAIRSDGFSHPAIAAGGPYDLIICNMLAHQLVAMARPMEQVLAQDGSLLLSGMLAWQRDETQSAFTSLGFALHYELTAQPWHTLILSRSPGFSPL